MKKFFKKCLIFIVISFAVFAPILPTYAYASSNLIGKGNTPSTKDSGTGSGSNDSGSNDSGSGGGTGGCNSLLPGLVSWYCGVNLEPSSTSDLENNAKTIITNVSGGIFAIAGYLAAGFIIYGGYLYMSSSGDPAKTTAGKKTLTRAFIGLAVIIFAKIIVSSIGIAFMNNAGAFDSGNCVQSECVTAESLLQNTISWVIGIGGFISAIFVVVGGYNYITASGDPTKLQKAKATISYALIGLAIVGLSLVITNFAIDMLNSSNTGNDISEPIRKLLVSIIGLAGVVAVIFLVKGGVGYMTSTGDPTKLKKARDTILYACVGLVICALAFVIVNWAINAINSSSGGSGKQSSLESQIA